MKLVQDGIIQADIVEKAVSTKSTNIALRLSMASFKHYKLNWLVCFRLHLRLGSHDFGCEQQTSRRGKENSCCTAIWIRKQQFSRLWCSIWLWCSISTTRRIWCSISTARRIWCSKLRGKNSASRIFHSRSFALEMLTHRYSFWAWLRNLLSTFGSSLSQRVKGANF